jgi:predicted exporter
MPREMFLLVLVSAAFGALGLLCLGFGIESAVRGAAFDTSVYVGVSVLCFYPSHLLGRAAVRARRELIANPLTPDEKRTRHKMFSGVLVYTVLGIATVLFVPYPAEVKVIFAIVSIVVAALAVAQEFEPPKKRSRNN